MSGRTVHYRHYLHVQPNVVGLDLEESVVDITCQGNEVVITGTSLQDLQAWGVGSKVVMSRDWGCTFADTVEDNLRGSFFRTVTSRDGPFAVAGSLNFVVKMTTIVASKSDVFQEFKLRFNVTQPTSEGEGEGEGGNQAVRHRRDGTSY